jgi:hypothetical protein
MAIRPLVRLRAFRFPRRTAETGEKGSTSSADGSGAQRESPGYKGERGQEPT